MSIKLELVRPDDLLNLVIESENLRLDPGENGSSSLPEPALVPEDPSKDAYLIITFPPQTVAEQAFFESSPVQPLPGEAAVPSNQTPGPHAPPDLETYPDPPAQARLGGPSRLVFRLPAGSNPHIPLSYDGLLDWEQLELSVSALAALPTSVTPEQQKSAPAIKPPDRLESNIELPYRLHLSPNKEVAWLHALQPKTSRGITELWHTRLAIKRTTGEIDEISRARPAPIRAIWSPDYNDSKFEDDDPPKFMEPDAGWNVLTPMTPSDRHEIVILTSGFRGFVRDKNDHRSYQPAPVYAEQLMLSPLGGWLKSRGSWDPPVPYKSLFIFPPKPDGHRWDELIREAFQLPPGRVPPIPGPPGPRPAPGPGRPPGPPHGPPGLPPDPPPGRGLLLDPFRRGRLVRPGPSEGQSSSATGAQDPDSLDDQAAAAASLGVSPGAGIFDPSRTGSMIARLNELDLQIVWTPITGTTGALLNISEWSHIATQGRDHYVRIVYEGHLYPFGHRASLVKVSERKIREVKLQSGGSTPLAYLVQRMFIVVRQPFRDYTHPDTAKHLENAGRGLPFRNIRLLTVVTPDIASPVGSSKLVGTSSFWVRLGSGSSPDHDFKFHLAAEDFSGQKVNFNASLVFVPFSEGNRAEVVDQYLKSGEARLCPVPGQKVAYDRDNPGNNTNLTTEGLYFTTHTAPLGKTFGGFLPKLFKASVRLPAVEAMLGRPSSADIQLAGKYLSADPGNTTGLFAEIVSESVPGALSLAKLSAPFDASQAGGFATPDLSISGLTAKLGPLAGSLNNAASDLFDPADFFGDVQDTALLFGSLKLSELLKPLTMSAGAPKLRFSQEKLPPPNDNQTLLRAELDWTPEVKELKAGIVVFHPKRNGADASLVVSGRMEQIIAPPPSVPPQPAARMEGSLTDFTIELLNIVEVRFVRFGFKSETGRKPDVSVALDPGAPVKFIGDLKFVEELRKQIPPDLFGDGPSLDINAQRIKAGFSISLPPVAVGVFALREVVLAAFIELPFRDGRPLFDFSFSSRERPFNLTVTLFGGGGFFHIQLDTKGIKMLEAALEFGASASVNLGVASGGVYIMAGIYFSIQRRMIDGKEVDAATLAGYLRMGGELSVLGLISVSLEFYLIFAYESSPKSSAYGRATLTVKVEVLFFSKSVQITVEKRFGGSPGDPFFLEGFDTPAVWEDYAGAFA